MALRRLALASWLVLCACSNDDRAPGSSTSKGVVTGSGGMGTGGDATSGGTGGSGGQDTGSGGTSNASGGATASAGGTGGASGGGTNGGGAAGASGDAGAGGEAGGPPEPSGPVTIAFDQVTPTGIAVSGDYVVFANRDVGTIAKCPLTGCDGAPEIIVADQDAPIAVALDGDDLYWVTGWREGDSGAPTSRPVFRCPIDDCTDETITEFDAGMAEPYGLRVTNDLVYLAAWPRLIACPKKGCSDEATMLAGGPAVAVDVDATTLVVSMAGWSEALACSPGGCDESTVIASNVLPLGIALDDTYVYIAQHRFFNLNTVITPGIVRCPRSGCGNEPHVVHEAQAPYGLAQRANRLYYTDLEAGTVVSIPKP